MLALLLGAGSPAGGQGFRADARNEVFAGSEMEDYLRLLQVTGEVSPYPWSVRGLSPREVDRLAPADSTHPWAARYDLSPAGAEQGVGLVSPELRLTFNSAFPYGQNDGAVWAGRGLTTALRFGIAGRYGPLSWRVAPVLFRAENAGFDLDENGRSGSTRFADGDLPTEIDLPQRFGEGPYARLDPGQSTLRVDAGAVAVGISTANQFWGPAVRHPIVLGNNAPGFPHVFFGSAAPLDVGIGRLHGRLVWGRLSQSPYSTVSPDSAGRLMSGLVAVLSPRGLPNVEVGFSRFYHVPWVEGGVDVSDLLLPLEGFLKRGSTDPTDESARGSNQLASVFARWVAPGSGFEVYGEYGREDHSWNLRDLLLEPDHSGGYALGFRKVWDGEGSKVGLRGEVINTRVSHIARARYQGPFYQHPDGRGHTERGQILGSPLGYGGGGGILAIDYYHAGGRVTGFVTREVRDYQPMDPAPEVEVDALHTLGGEALLFRGGFDLTLGVTGVYNRHRDQGADIFNLNAAVGVRARI